jgi:hypothetical protein
MRKLLLLLAMSMIPLAGLAPRTKIITIAMTLPIEPFKTLMRATSWVESLDNPNALNHSEMAVGLFQIRPIRLKDYNARTGSRLKLKDCYNPDISKKIWLYYASQFHPEDQEKISKAWNGRGKSNEIYWQKIKKRLNNLEIKKQ